MQVKEKLNCINLFDTWDPTLDVKVLFVSCHLNMSCVSRTSISMRNQSSVLPATAAVHIFIRVRFQFRMSYLFSAEQQVQRGSPCAPHTSPFHLHSTPVPLTICCTSSFMHYQFTPTSPRVESCPARMHFGVRAWNSKPFIMCLLPPGLQPLQNGLWEGRVRGGKGGEESAAGRV